MTITTTPTTAARVDRAPTSPPPARRVLWAVLAFGLGGIVGAGVTLAVEDDVPAGSGGSSDIVSDVRPGPAARSTDGPFVSADASDRRALHRREAACTGQPGSADAAERCLAATRE